MRSSEFGDKIILKICLLWEKNNYWIIGDGWCRGSIINDHVYPRVYLHFRSQRPAELFPFVAKAFCPLFRILVRCCVSVENRHIYLR